MLFTAKTITLEQAKIWQFRASCFSSHLIGPYVAFIIALDWLSKNACQCDVMQESFEYIWLTPQLWCLLLCCISVKILVLLHV